MGAIRQIYIIIPTLLAAVAFALLLVAFLDQVTQSSSLLSSLHFLELNSTNLTIPSASAEVTTITTAMTSTLADTYTIGLWNSCATFSNGTTLCTTPTAAYAFDPLAAFGLSTSTTSTIEALIPSAWSDALATYRAASKWLFAAYCAAIALAGITILTGLLACALSRASACCTALLAWLAALAAIAASATATALFLTVKNLIEDRLGTYGLTAALGTRLLGVSWAGAALMLVAALAWLFGCCCTGARREHKSRHERERAHDYEPLVGPYKQVHARAQHGKHASGGPGYTSYSYPMPMQHGKHASGGPGYTSYSYPMPMQQAEWHGQRKTAYEPLHGGERV